MCTNMQYGMIIYEGVYYKNVFSEREKYIKEQTFISSKLWITYLIQNDL